MKKSMLLFTVLLTACAAQPRLQRAEFTSDLYLCQSPNTPENKAEINKRGIDCRVALNKSVNGAKFVEKEEKIVLQKKPEIRNISDRVLADNIDQYNIVYSSGGSYLDLCVQAGMVKAAALQAKNQEYYIHWNEIESINCTIAGVPR